MANISRNLTNELPEDRSTVLLLGVTRIPTSPAPARRPCSLPLATPDDSHQNPSAQARRSSFTRRRRNSSSASRRRPADKNVAADCSLKWSVGETPQTDGSAITPSNCPACNETSASDRGPVMERSVDSIGTCSLDVEASADLSDWSEASSGGTLRSASLKTPSAEPHLPSYLSLACTVNGYSTTTNYDPERLARSRDASPHRPQNDNLTPRNQPTYTVQNNLLSPPNLVPLPIHVKPKMAENTLAQQQQHQEFYRSTKTMTFVSKESRLSSNIYEKDTVDACYENGHAKNHIVTCETKNYSSATTTLNGQEKCTSEGSYKSYSNGTETKSFIQQRVERLYGPGALAQGFFVMKRQKNRDSESESEERSNLDDSRRAIKSPNKSVIESPMKQSTSSPTLPVMRHLRPEFRAQLPIISPRKGTESVMQKSSTVPTLTEEPKVNGHSKQLHGTTSEGDNITKQIITEASGEKDGHYFLKILQREADRLLKLAENVEAELSNEQLPEEIVGKIRSASGKARLLVSQKMQQFKGLCTNNITQGEGEAFPTTNEDLQGFWDMVMLQVDQVDTLFRELNALKINNWQEIKPVTVVKSSNILSNNKIKRVMSKARPVSAANEEARKQREAQRRQMIEERRKAMRAQNNPMESIEIFVPESS